MARARGSNYLLLFGEGGVTFLLRDKNDLQAIAERRSARIGHSLPGQALQRKYNVIQMKLERSHPWTGITGDGLTAGVSNYLHPGDEKAEIRGIPQYERVKISDVYKGSIYCSIPAAIIWNMTLCLRLARTRHKSRWTSMA